MSKRPHFYFIGYLRLSEISRQTGKFDEATLWLSKALSIDESNPNALCCQGDLLVARKRFDDAKKSFEKVLTVVCFPDYIRSHVIFNQNKRDARALVSLGNLYQSSLGSKHSKESYKFFHHALTEDKKNVYAAAGIGIVCAEKGVNAQARDIFFRVRE